MTIREFIQFCLNNRVSLDAKICIDDPNLWATGTGGYALAGIDLEESDENWVCFQPKSESMEQAKIKAAAK